MDLWLSPHDFRVRSLKTLQVGFHCSRFGECVALATDSHLLALHFLEDRAEATASLQAAWSQTRLLPSPRVGPLIEQALHAPKEVPVMAIGRPFQLTVWEFLRRTPLSVTLTYGEVALAIGHPKSARAVGRAVGSNPLAVVIPCHRVVSRGKLTGYRWGLERKKSLLAWELANRDPLQMPF